MKKVNIRLALSSLLLVSLLLTSCKEWDDHYEAETAVEGSATATLWENISANANLSQFATLVKKAGYEDFLKATQTLTVWAPLNGTFDYDALLEEGNEKLLKEFVQNHIARNNYPASGRVEKNIFMLNKKRLLFEGNGNYTMDGIEVAQPNVASSNGVIHTISGKLQFRYNILESLKADEFPIDSISDYIHSYDEMWFNEAKSVQGPVVDGQLTYLDSVFTEYNAQTAYHNAFINVEDSNYTMIVPSNKAWEKAMNYIRKCYNYAKFSYVDVTTSEQKKTDEELIPDAATAAYWQDSISHNKLLTGLFYNNNLYDNKKLKNLRNGELPEADSLMTTYFDRIYKEDARNLFTGTTRSEKSNGAIHVTDDSLRMAPWLIWNPIINIETETTNNQGTVNAGSLTSYWIGQSNVYQNPRVQGSVSSSGYAVISPSMSSGNPGFNVKLNNVRSTTYVIYCVFVPAHIQNAYIPEESLQPNNVQVQIGFCKADGTLPTRATTLGTFETFKNKDFNSEEEVSEDNPAYFFNKLDTVCFGEVTFPVCYYGMTGYPYLNIQSRAERRKHDNTLRIDRVFLVPKELDDYMKEHPGYTPYYFRYS